MKTVIMAGGKGTRISTIAHEIPKPMIPVEGKPVLEHELESLREQGFVDVLITVSHLGDKIMAYFGDGSGISPATGKPFGVHIEYYVEKEPLGNAGALFKIRDKLDGDFLLLNADALFDVDFKRFVAFHETHGGLVTLFTHPNSHPYDSGLIVADPSTFVALGDLSRPSTLLSVFGVCLCGVLMTLNVRGALIIGIIVLGLTPLPDRIFSTSVPLPAETFAALDIRGALSHGLLSIIFTLTMVDLFDNMGVLIALARKAGFMKEDGRIENLDRALVTDSIGTMTSAVLGATTATSYLECAAGVAEGGRTGLSAVCIALLFALALFMTPLVAVVPGYATAPVLIIVGALMMQDVTRIRFDDFATALPAFLTIISMPLTFNIATGFGLGFIAYVLLRLLSGRGREVAPMLYIVAVCFAVNFALR